MILARFIRLCTVALASPKTKDAAAVIVNRISELVYVDRAVIIDLTAKDPIFAISGGGNTPQGGNFVDAVNTVKRRYAGNQQPALIPQTTQDDTHLYQVQQSMGGTTVLWIPLWLKNDPAVSPAHALWVERWKGVPWDDTEIELLQRAALFLGHALIPPKEKRIDKKRKYKKYATIGALILFLMFPVTSTVTAPSKVVPDRPAYVFAPMDGILRELYVQPGNYVNMNQILFRYDSRVLDKRLDEAARSVAVARAKLARLEGAAHRDPEARAEIPVQTLEVERAKADVEFYAEQKARSEVRAPKAGIVVLDDPDSLIGSALQTGEAVLSLADPGQTKLKIMASASDVEFLKKGAQVSIRLDSDPFRSIAGNITRIGFDVTLSEDQTPTVIAEAIWLEQDIEVHPGQRASAKIYGRPTTLGMQILRKPLIAIRNLVGI